MLILINKLLNYLLMKKLIITSEFGFQALSQTQYSGASVIRTPSFPSSIVRIDEASGYLKCV